MTDRTLDRRSLLAPASSTAVDRIHVNDKGGIGIARGVGACPLR